MTTPSKSQPTPARNECERFARRVLDNVAYAAAALILACVAAFVYAQYVLPYVAGEGVGL